MMFRSLVTKERNLDVEFYVRCRKVACLKGYSEEVCEDFPSWAFERMKAGSRATIDQLLIDYLRTTFGVSGSTGQRLRRALRAAGENEAMCELAEAGDSYSPSFGVEREALWSMVQGKDREMLEMYFCEGLSKKEIGEAFGVTEARISQKMKALLGRLRSEFDEV